MSQGKDRTIFTITSAHDPNSDPVPFNNPNFTFGQIRFRRNYRMRYPLSLPVLQTQNMNTNSLSSTDVSNTSTRSLNRSSSTNDSEDGLFSAAGTSNVNENISGISVGIDVSNVGIMSRTDDGSLLTWDIPSESDESDSVESTNTSNILSNSISESISSSSSEERNGSELPANSSFRNIRQNLLRNNYSRFFRRP